MLNFAVRVLAVYRRIALVLGSALAIGAVSVAVAQPTPAPPAGVDFSVEKRGGRYLVVAAGMASDGAYRPKRLTVWLPKGMKLSAKRCSKASARKITLDDRQGCNKLFGGRWYGGESGAYLGYAGPRTDSGQRLWLRFRDDEAENTLSGFATGVTAKGPRGYGQKITLEVGAFGRDLQAIEFGSQVVKARSGLRCPDGGWRLRMRMETNADTGTDSARAPC